MNIDENLINGLIEREIKRQLNSKIDRAIERIVTREVEGKLSSYPIIDYISDIMNRDKEFKKNLASACATNLYNNLVADSDEYDDDDYYED